VHAAHPHRPYGPQQRHGRSSASSRFCRTEVDRLFQRKEFYVEAFDPPAPSDLLGSGVARRERLKIIADRVCSILLTLRGKREGPVPQGQMTPLPNHRHHAAALACGGRFPVLRILHQPSPHRFPVDGRAIPLCQSSFRRASRAEAGAIIVTNAS